MTKIGRPALRSVINIRRRLRECLRVKDIESVEASSLVTGRDFLLKIWHMILSVPLGVGIISEEMGTSTVANIFYEVGLLQALGKETVIIKTPSSDVPSDFVRTEYIEYDRSFSRNMKQFLDNFFDRAEYYSLMASQLRNSPEIALDYARRAYLIGGENYRERIVKTVLNEVDTE